jgi:hypothetical protein
MNRDYDTGIFISGTKNNNNDNKIEVGWILTEALG